MRIGTVIDPSCDLPPEFIQRHNIKVLPTLIRVDRDLLADDRNPEATLAFYENHIGDKTHDAETFPYSVDQIQQFFLERLVLEFDYVFCVPPWKQRSRLYENAMRASFAILSSYRKRRADAGVNGPFQMRVIDSRNLFSGVGVQVAEVMRLAAEGVQHNEIRARLGQITEHTVGYIVPADLAYIRQRAIKRGEKSVGLAAYLVGTALDIKPVISLYREETRPVAKPRGYEAAAARLLRHVAEVVRGGNLLSRHVCLSYGGNLGELPGMPGYAELDAACRERGLELLVSIMSAAAAVNVGAGVLSVAYAGEYREMH